MKRIKLLVVMAALALVSAPCFADGLGYINYEKVLSSYDLAKTVAKDLDAKGMEIQQYLMDREKEFKSIDTPVRQQAFKDKVAAEYKAKEEAYIKYRINKEKEVFTKVQSAAKIVMAEQKLDAIVDIKAVFAGGVDITDIVIDRLKGIKY